MKRHIICMGNNILTKTTCCNIYIIYIQSITTNCPHPQILQILSR